MPAEPLTADTVTDEQIRDLMRTGLSDRDFESCQEALSWGTRFARQQRARCAEIINARRAIEARRCSACDALCDHESWDGINCPYCINGRLPREAR